MCPAYCLHSCFRHAKVFNLPFLNQILHRTSHIFDGHSWVNAVLVEQVDGIDLESLERSFGDPLDLLGSAIQSHPGTRPTAGIMLEPKLGCDHHLLVER